MSLVLLVPLARAAPQPVLVEVGADAGAGNVVGVQAWMEPLDYRTPEAFAARLGGWLDAAREAGWLGPATVVALPEYVGTWLVAIDEPDRVLRAPTVKKAMTRLVMRHLGDWRRAKPEGVEDPATSAVFAMKADRVAEVYGAVMADLAREHGVTLVAGSVLLPGPLVRDGELVPTPGQPLRNVSLVFGPDGAILAGPVVKSFPTKDELAFVAPGEAKALPVVDAPIGRLGVLVCADGWFPPAWDAMVGAGASFVVVPQYTSGDGAWSAPWHGYSGWPTPDDVPPEALQGLTEGQAWARFGPTGRGAARGLDVLTVPLRGDLWDLGDDGVARWVIDGVAGEGPLVDGPVLVNLWLPQG